MAHELYYTQRNWRAAIGLWSACEAVDGSSLDSRFAITHCRIELADEGSLPSIGLTEAPAIDRGHLAAYAHFVRSRAFHCLTVGDALRASQLTRLLATVEPQLARVYRDAIAPSDLGRPLAAPDDAGQPLPFERDQPALDTSAAQALVDELRSKRILFVFRHLLNYAGGVIEADLYIHLTTSMRALGLQWAGLDAHGRTTPERHHLFPDELRAAIAEMRPDVLIYDDLLVSGVCGNPALQPAILDILDHARRTYGTRIAATYPDAWYDGMEGVFESARDVADVFHICHPGLLPRLSAPTRRKMLCYPYPCTDPRPPDRRPPAAVDRACFVGSVNWASMSRLVWWTEIQRSGAPVDIYPTLGWTERSAEEYAALLARYRMVVNLTTRANQRRILTQRAIETPLLGSLLLEEFSEDTTYFMRPFEHYVPFDNLIQLGTRLQQLIADPALCARITERGSAWVRRQFTGLQFWARLYRQLTGPDTGPPSHKPHYRPVAIDIPTTSSALVGALSDINTVAG